MGIMQEGRHNGATVTRLELAEPKPGKADQIIASFENAAGEYITDYLSLSDAAFTYTEKKLRACGWTGNDVSDMSECIGKRVNLVVKNEEYNGAIKQRVSGIYAATAHAVAPATAKSIADKYKARFSATAAADKRPEPPQADDSELPF